MSILSAILDASRNSMGHLRAKALAKNDLKYLRDLVAARRAAGLSQGDVAERMGISQQAVSKLERYDSDPKLSTLRRYAHAVEAIVTHEVMPSSAQAQWQGAPLVFAHAHGEAVPKAYPISSKADFALAG